MCDGYGRGRNEIAGRGKNHHMCFSFHRNVSLDSKHVGLLVVAVCAHNNIIVLEYLTTDIANMIAQVMEWIVEFTLHT